MDFIADAMFVHSPNLCPKHLTRDYWKYLDYMKNSKHGGVERSTEWKRSNTSARYGRSRRKKATGANAGNLPLTLHILLHRIPSESADMRAAELFSKILTVRLRHGDGQRKLWNGIHTRLERMRLM